MRPVPCLFLFFLAIAGCAPGDTGPAADISPITPEMLGSALAARKGNITMVNLWATWCRPCMDELPALARIREDFSDRGVELILISTDDPDDADSVVIPTLKKLGIHFQSYIIAGGDQDGFIRFMHPDWTGALPASFLYDRTGRLSGWFVGERTYESFASKIRELLNE